MKKFLLLSLVFFAAALVSCGGSSKKDALPSNVQSSFDTGRSFIEDNIVSPQQAASIVNSKMSSISGPQNGSGTTTTTTLLGCFKIDETLSSTGTSIVYTYSVSVIADHVVPNSTFTFKTGGTETMTMTLTQLANQSTISFTEIANYPFIDAGPSHTLGWSFQGAVSNSTESFDGTVTYDGVTYSYSE